MLGFTYEKNENEVIEMIKGGVLDEEIKDYCKELIGDNENIQDIQGYFDLSYLNKDDGYITVGANIWNDQKYNNLTKSEKQVHNEFQERVNSIYHKLK